MGEIPQLLPFVYGIAILVCFIAISHQLIVRRRKNVSPLLLGTLAGLSHALCSYLAYRACMLYYHWHPAPYHPGSPGPEFAIGIAFAFSFIAAPFIGIVTIIAGYLLYRARPKLEGICICGYDLTGNVSGICPECGRTVSHVDPSER